MQLINTIEINPHDYANEAYEYPGGGSIKLPDEWNQFWKRCISDKNLGRLEAIRKGGYLVDMTTINEEELVEILKNELEEVELSDFEEQVGLICGGIVLRENDTIYMEPTCCGDIGNIQEWESIFGKEVNTWHELWVGHPWVYYRRNNGVIEFSHYTEENLEELKDIQILVNVAELELQTEVKKVRAQQNDFERSIRKVLDKMGVANGGRISKLMTGNV